MTRSKLPKGPRVPPRRIVPADPAVLARMVRLLGPAVSEEEQLLALELAAARELRYPAAAFVVGEPVEAQWIHYRGRPRSGLAAVCLRAGVIHEVALESVVFPKGTDGAGFVSMYRAWLGIGEPLQVAGSQNAGPGARPEASTEDVTIGEPVELVVLACKKNALVCRLPGSLHRITLRTAVRDEVPGEIVTVVPTKTWTHARHTYVSGAVQSSRSDAGALGLVPLELRDEGAWDPKNEYWREKGDPLESWALQIVARGRRTMFEMEQVLPGADPDDFEYNPIYEAAELRAAGQIGKAHDLLMSLLSQDLRCIDAHAHLGNQEFDRRPEQALRHYEMGRSIAALSLGTDFDGVLPWGLIDNRPYLRCLHGLGLCLWRTDRTSEAAEVFRRMLWLNPTDNQGARFNLEAVEAGLTWEEAEA